jgi:hypothetical protein
VRSFAPVHFHIITVNLSGIVKRMEGSYTAEIVSNITRLIVHGSQPDEFDSAKAECSGEDEDGREEKGDMGQGEFFIVFRTAQQGLHTHIR